jgi:predicted nucleic acid-binding protein
LTGSPSAGTAKKVAKKKADNPNSNVTVTPYKVAKITDLSANKRAGQVRKDASPSGAAASRKLYEQKQANKKKIATLQDTMKRMKASGSTAADLVNIKTKIAKLKG